MNTASTDLARATELADFAAAEAALLDAGRYDEWLALFADDGRYWVPLQGALQADPHSHNSLAYEDRLLLALRIERLKNPRAHSQHPRSSCQHVLQRSMVEACAAVHAESHAGADAGAKAGATAPAASADADENAAAGTGAVRLRTPFLYIEARGDEQVMLSGVCRHRLVQISGAWKIREKRIDLLNPERPLPAVQLFI